MIKRAIPPMIMAFFSAYVLTGALQAVLFSDLSATAGQELAYRIQAALWAGLQRAAYIPANLLLGAAAATGVLWYERKQERNGQEENRS